MEPNLTYELFVQAYTANFKWMMMYTPDQTGSQHFAARMAELADKYPDFLARFEKQ